MCVLRTQAELSLLVQFFNKWLKLGSSWDGQVECLGSEEGLQVKEVKVVVVYEVCQQLVAKAIQGGHDGQREAPLAICAAIHQPL